MQHEKSKNQDWQAVKVFCQNEVGYLQFNRPNRSNAMNEQMWLEIKLALQYLDNCDECRVIIVSGNGKNFSSGADLEFLASVNNNDIKDEGRKREHIRKHVLWMQECFSVAEKCRKPIIAAVHGVCYGGALDFITACDIRICAADSIFCIKEIDFGIVADIGVLQRLPHLVGNGIVTELAMTGRTFDSQEAQKIGLVSKILTDKETLMKGAQELANNLLQKSPLALWGIKNVIQYSRSHSVEDSLNYVAVWNSAMVLNNDVQESFLAKMEKRKPVYARL